MKCSLGVPAENQRLRPPMYDEAFAPFSFSFFFSFQVFVFFIFTSRVFAHSLFIYMPFFFFCSRCTAARLSFKVLIFCSHTVTRGLLHFKSIFFFFLNNKASLFTLV